MQVWGSLVFVTLIFYRILSLLRFIHFLAAISVSQTFIWRKMWEWFWTCCTSLVRNVINQQSRGKSSDCSDVGASRETIWQLPLKPIAVKCTGQLALEELSGRNARPCGEQKEQCRVWQVAVTWLEQPNTLETSGTTRGQGQEEWWVQQFKAVQIPINSKTQSLHWDCSGKRFPWDFHQSERVSCN